MRNLNQDAQQSFAKIVNNLAGYGLDAEPEIDFEFHKKLLDIFQAGSYYYYVFNLKLAEHEFVSPEIEDVMGHEPHTWTVALLMSSIHPEDMPWFLNFENRIAEFFSNLHPDQILKYKVRYDYRLRKSNGEYVRVLQQMIAIQYNAEKRAILRTLGIHTDITYLNKKGRPVLSLIGLEGEPSYIDVDVKKVFTTTNEILSVREKQILFLLIAGKTSKTIAQQLFISIETVTTHRKNMLRKTNTSSTAELVALAVKSGWI